MSSKNIQIDYYAVLREARGLSSEDVETSAGTLEELYDQLKEKHGFQLSTDRLRVAVNDRFCHWGTRVNNGDKIVFIPPVAGG